MNYNCKVGKLYRAVEDVKSLNHFLYFISGITGIFLFGLFLYVSISRNDLTYIINSYPFIIVFMLLTRDTYKKCNKRIKEIERGT